MKKRVLALATIVNLCVSGCGSSESYVYVGTPGGVNPPGPLAGSPRPDPSGTATPGSTPTPTNPEVPSPPEQPRPGIFSVLQPALASVLGACQTAEFLTSDPFLPGRTPSADQALETMRVSHSSERAGGQGSYPVVEDIAQSGDGNTIAFTANSVNLAFGSTTRKYLHSYPDNDYLYVRNVTDGTTKFIDFDRSGSDFSPSSIYSLRLSDNGRYLFFKTDAQLVPQDTNSKGDLYRLDLSNNSYELGSVDSVGQATGDTVGPFNPVFAADGSYVIYYADTSSPVPGEPPDTMVLYDFDARTNVSLGAGYLGGDSVGTTRISDDGNLLVITGTFGGEPRSQVYLLNRSDNTRTRLSNSMTGDRANASAFDPIISADGSYVVFKSFATNIVPGDSNEEIDIFGLDLVTGEYERINVSSDGTQQMAVTDDELDPQETAISADGRFVVFKARADGLVPGDSNGQIDLFLRDRVAGTTTMVSVNSAGDAETGPIAKRYDEYIDAFVVHNPCISKDGRYITYSSSGVNLVPGDTNNGYDVFRYDRVTGLVRRESVRSDGQQMYTNGRSQEPVISGNGGVVAFNTYGDQLVDIPPEVLTRFYEGVPVLRDLATPIFENLLVKDDGSAFVEPNQNYPKVLGKASLNGMPSALSDDGLVAAFFTCEKLTELDEAPHISLISGVCNVDSYVYRRGSKTTELLSITPNGKNAQPSFAPSLSGDGFLAAFQTRSTRLDPIDTSSDSDIYLRDRRTGALQLQTVSPDGAALGGSLYGKLSGDGRFLAFVSEASALDPQGRALAREIFVRKLSDGSTCRLTKTLDGNVANGDSTLGWGNAVSTQGRYVTFSGSASNLVVADDNGFRDVFVVDRGTDTLKRISVPLSGGQSNGPSEAGGISGDGRFVVFSSDASNLVANDANGVSDVFVYDQLEQRLLLVSANAAGEQGDGPSVDAAISRDGRYIVFSSRASNLDSGDDNLAADIFRVRNPLSL